MIEIFLKKRKEKKNIYAEHTRNLYLWQIHYNEKQKL
jgi:hypothetical protein